MSANRLLLLAVALLPCAALRGAGLEPETQSEKDWVDGRWSQTEIGQFLASALPLPDGVVAKGLSIRVGEGDAATVCYDTGAGLWRAGWEGFLKLDPARFGLIRPPRPAGAPVFLAPGRRLEGATEWNYTGLRLSRNRVVLTWRAGDTEIHESPWYTKSGLRGLFSRSFQFSPGGEIVLGLFKSQKGEPLLQRFGTIPGAELETASGTIAVAWLGDTNAALEIGAAHLRLRVGPRAHQQTGTVVVWPAALNDAANLETILVQCHRNTDFKALASAGPARWLPEMTMRGQAGLETDILAIDTLTVPYQNPWKALFFLSGVDFLSSGVAFVSSIHGDVWRVSGIDDTLRNVQWKRFATGLYQPLGLRVVNGNIYVLGRDQITQLVDENNDGEADLYRNFCGLIETSAGGHDYVACLEVDPAGQFYYVDPRGVHRVSADGKKKEILATGWRNPNGLGVGPGGIITVAPQQGEWTPSSALYEVRPGAYYGYGGPRPSALRPLGYDEPLLWIPHAADNSSGSQVWVPENHWGPLGGQMLHLVWGRCSMMLVLRDGAGPKPHGAALPLPGRFLSGPMRGAFNQYDGHLYVAGSTGWQTSAVKDGSLQRVRFTGRKVYLPVGFHVGTNEILLQFAQPLRPDTAEDTGSYAISQWNYKYAKEYGSPDVSVANPSQKGRDSVELKSAGLSPDGCKVRLEFSALQPVMQMEIKYNLDAVNGRNVRGVLYTTIHLPPG